MESTVGLPTLQDREWRDDFSLLGGPLHRFGRSLGLVRGSSDTMPLGLAIAGFAWLMLVGIAITDGVASEVFSLSVIGGHVRLLVVIPLFFACESLLDPRAATFVHLLVKSRVVPPPAAAELGAAVDNVRRWARSPAGDLSCLLFAALMSLDFPRFVLPGTTAAFDRTHVGGTALWYWFVCLPLFRFLALRWATHLLLWWYFLWRLRGLPLALVPAHPDGSGGLGYLEVVHAEFATLAFAVSAALSAAFAESILAGTMPFDALYPSLVMLLAFDVAIFLGPLCMFTPKLWLSRVKGLDTYMDLASRYVMAFEKKWLDGGATPRDRLLGTPDVQTLADLSTSMDRVTSMRLFPARRRLVFILAASALLPMIPLLLLRFPVGELTEKVFSMLVR